MISTKVRAAAEHIYKVPQPSGQLFHRRGHRQDSSSPLRIIGKSKSEEISQSLGCSKFGLESNGIVGVEVTCRAKLTLPRTDKPKLVTRRILYLPFPGSFSPFFFTTLSSNPKMNPNPYYELYRRSRYKCQLLK